MSHELSTERRKSNVSELEKGLLEVTGQVGSLLSITSKLENAVEQISDTMQILARKEVTVEQHTKSIDSFTTKIAELEDDVKNIMIEINSRCDIHQLHSTKEELEQKVNGYIDDLYRFNWKMLMASITVTTTIAGVIFSYILISKNEHDLDSHRIVETLKTMNTTMIKVDKTVSNIVIKQEFLQDKIDDAK